MTEDRYLKWSSERLSLPWSSVLQSYLEAVGDLNPGKSKATEDELALLVHKSPQMKVPKTEQNSKNVSLSGMHKEENHPTPGSLPPSNPPNTPGDGGSGGNIKTEIKQEGGGTTTTTTTAKELVGEIKKELQQHNGLDASLDDLKPSLEDVKPKLEDCLSTLAEHDADSKVLGGPMGGHNIPSSGIPTPNNLSQTPGVDASGNALAGGTLPAGGGSMPVQQPSGPLTPMDGHFLQQQSQIFVFSTNMANKAADSVRVGLHKTIRDFHLDQEGTKKFLEKHKMQFPAQRPNMAGGPPQQPGDMQMPPGATGVNGSKGSPLGIPPNNTMSSVEQWVRTQNINLEQGHFSSPTDAAAAAMNNPSCQSPMGQPNFPNRSMMGGSGGGAGPPLPGMQSPGAMDNFHGLRPPSVGLAHDGQGNLSQNKVPDDNLTPEQLQRREERLANLRKLEQMLFPEHQRGGPNGQGPGPPGAIMGPGGMPPNMMGLGGGGGPPMSSGPPGMHSPNSMLSSMAGGPPGPMGPGGPPHMGGGPGGPPFPGGLPPPNFESMTPAQREWFKLQQDYYNDKRRKQEMDRMRHIQQMQQMGMNLPPGEGGPGPGPPHFFRMHGPGMPPGGGPMSPTSPNFNGCPGGPMEPGFMMGPRRPGPMGPMGPGGPPNFDPMGPMGPGGPMGFPFGKDEMMMRGPMKGGGNMPMIQRAGNPEQFNDMIPPITGPTGGPISAGGGGTTKPPPPYGQSNKRKRSGDDMDELYKKLQPAPSPQQFSYLNQFEGQELTITKQLNMAYQETGQQPQQPQQGVPPPPGPGGGQQHDKSPAQQQQQQQPTPTSQHQQNSGPPQSSNSLSSHPHPKSQQTTSQPPTPSASQPQPSPRPHATPSSSNIAACSSAPPLSNVSSPHTIAPTTSRPSSRPSSVSGTTSAITAAMLPPSPLTMTITQTGPSLTTSSTQVSTSASNSNSQRLSHFDLPSPQVSSGMSKTKSKEHMNITSTNLVHLAKGVEHLSNQMQQSMMQGGPYHNIQIQGQISEMDNHPGPGGGPPGPGNGMPPGAGGGPQSTNSGSCSIDNQGQPSVNNTYVNATMSIGQLNIQSIHPGQGGGNFSANMQTQQMNNEMMGGPGHPNMHPTGPNRGMMNPSQMMPDHPAAMGPMPPCSSQANLGSGPLPSMAQRPFPSQSPSLTGAEFQKSSVGIPAGNSTGNAPPPVGNASVQIQAKAPNTIQYLPAHPPTSQSGGGSAGPAPRKEEMGAGGVPPRFPSPLSNLDSLPGPGVVAGGGSRNKFMGGGGRMPPSPLDMMNPAAGMGGGGMPPHMGGPGGPPQMSMQQSMMVPGGGSMQQQMGGPPHPGGMPYNSPSPMHHPGPGGPSPVDMMQMQQGQHMSMQGGGPMICGGGMRGEPGGMMGGPPQGGGYSVQYHQFQQQLYAQGRPRGSSGGAMNHMGGGMHPPNHMMGGPEHMMMGGGGPPMGPGCGGMPGGDMGMGPVGPGGMMGGPQGMMGGPLPHGMGPGPMGPHGAMGNMMGPGMPNMP